MHLPMSFIIDHTSGEVITASDACDYVIDHIMFDSRKQNVGSFTLFVNLSGERKHIAAAREKGVRVVLTKTVLEADEGETIIVVDNVLDELQKLAANYRAKSNTKFIGVTGSNGKTIVKEWLYFVLTDKFHCGKSPASYNSQLGVPLSILSIVEQNEIAIIEAGISMTGEMDKLQEMICPEIGILTTMGDAHSDGFESFNKKLEQKLVLFKDCKKLITEINSKVKKSDLNILTDTELITWSFDDNDSVYSAKCEVVENSARISIQGKNSVEFNFSHTDQASITNIINVVILALELEIPKNYIQSKIDNIQPVSLRLELKKAARNCLLINDSYNADLTSLQNALDFSITQKNNRSLTLIISEFDQQSNSSSFNARLNKLIKSYPIDELYYVGDGELNIDADFLFKNTKDLLSFIIKNKPTDQLILIKGARRFKLETIANFLEENQHRTILHTNLQVLKDNISFFKSVINESTKIMAVIKAGAYGSDSLTIGKYLESSGVDYLAVAYIEEGIELRNEGIQSPIMVMNPDPSLFNLAVEYNLEPEIYSFHQLHQIKILGEINVHIKIDSGMNRLGFKESDLRELIEVIKRNKNIQIKSVFSHLSSADDSTENDYSRKQDSIFNSIFDKLCESLEYKPLKHICNSHAAISFPEMHHDMIRIGIGMHGLMADKNLYSTHTLVTCISQVKEIESGDTVGYNQAFIASRKMKIATVSIGYADGFSRKHGHGNSLLFINGKACPTVGNISMDSCSIDVTDIDCSAGDEVVVFENKEQLFALCKTGEVIPYEFICGIGKRVARKFSLE